jgi:hypothetical protein
LKGNRVIRVPKILIIGETSEDQTIPLRYFQESLAVERGKIRKSKPLSKIILLLM